MGDPFVTTKVEAIAAEVKRYLADRVLNGDFDTLMDLLGYARLRAIIGTHLDGGVNGDFEADLVAAEMMVFLWDGCRAENNQCLEDLLDAPKARQILGRFYAR